LLADASGCLRTAFIVRGTSDAKEVMPAVRSNGSAGIAAFGEQVESACGSAMPLRNVSRYYLLAVSLGWVSRLVLD
jgi:hypothetical protein